MNEEKLICHQCVGDSYISQYILDHGDNDYPCSYCENDNVTISLDDIVEKMHDVFLRYYSTREDIYRNTPGKYAEEVIEQELMVHNDICIDIYESLEKNNNEWNEFYSNSYLYSKQKTTDHRHDYMWEKLKKSLKAESRFFNHELKTFFDKMFLNLPSSAFRKLTRDAILYRARVFEGYDDTAAALKHPERNFAPPPSELASAGRMNASGVPVFYGAASIKTAIAEVRPAVGNMVTVVQFRPLRTLKMLDISALDTLAYRKGSSFDPLTKKSHEVTSFLNTLSRKLTLPVSGKSRDSEYLITQAAAEYLSISESLQLDGVMFHSTQSNTPDSSTDDNYNYVLFRKSSHVAKSEAGNVGYNVNMAENPEDNVWIFSPSLTLLKNDMHSEYQRSHNAESEYEPSLEMDVGSMEIHTIKSISFCTDSMPVSVIEIDRE